jgi:hypothetical protein
LRGLNFGRVGGGQVFWWLDKFSGTVGDSRVSYGGRVAKSRNNKVFFKFVAIEAWAKRQNG